MSNVKSNSKASVKFLQKYSPDGLWVLTAIQTDRKAIETRTFDEARVGEALAWVEGWNGERNIYFHVNSTIGELTKKASREDVKSLDWLHVDIDPRAGEDIEFEQKRALNTLQKALPLGVPKPTVIIFSGGGYQAFWKLNDPMEVNGNEELYEEAKRYNVQLELLFGADNCHNVDRIMRLPGTINLPDAQKIKKGRKAVLATLVSFNSETYDLDQFRKSAEVKQADASDFTSSASVEIPTGEIERVQNLDDLDEWNISPRVKVIIAQGHHPDEPKDGDNSRSAWLFDALCHLARQEVPDRIIYSIITDPEWGIAESVVQLKSKADKYARRQIARAKEYVIDPWLQKLNAKYAVIGNIGGQCKIVSRVLDEAIGRERIAFQDFQAFKNYHMNKKVQIGIDANGKPIEQKVGQWWLEHPKRQEYESLTFAPNKELKDAYNLWQGFAVDAIPGECDLLLAHLKDNLCEGSEDHYDYLIKWLARMIQQPGDTGEVAVVLRGGRGTGKSFFANEIGALFGHHFLAVSNGAHLTGNFNGHLRDLVLLFADEAFYANDKKHESILKTIVTEPILAIERKGIDVEVARNCIHLIMASNDEHVIRAGQDERRFFVLNVAEDQKQNTAYFKAIKAQLNNGGREALLHYLLGVDLEGFEVRSVPKTDTLREQKTYSLNPLDAWWLDCLTEGRIMPDSDEWPKEIGKDQAHATYKRDVGYRAENRHSFGKLLFKACRLEENGKIVAEIKDGKVTIQVDTEAGFTMSKRVNSHVLPTLQQCRAAWDKIHGEQDWPDGGKLDLAGEIPERETPF